MISQPKKICIIGGGTTGWWAAAYFEKKFPHYEITVIESDTIPTVGVGETTLPMIGNFLNDELGLKESEWMPKCNAIKKLGSIKQGWDKIDGEEFKFTFWFNEDNRFDTWVKDYFNGTKSRHDINRDLYEEQNVYAYHLDANLIGQVVRDSCQRVQHITQTLTELPPGYDLYLDCTGFRRQFVQDTAVRTFDHHLVDSVWVCPFEHNDYNPPYTQTLARTNGWQFIVGLTNRIGSGYVYSSQHISDEEALAEFKEMTRDRIPFNQKQPRLLKWRPEVLANPWTDNVVAIGLAQGFIDPLESNSLFMTQFSITALANCLERGYGPKTYNRAVRNLWRDVSDYITHHYMLTNRVDTEFWRYYNKFDVKQSLWQHYQNKGSRYTNVYPSSLWATLALYYKEFTHYEQKL